MLSSDNGLLAAKDAERLEDAQLDAAALAVSVGSVESGVEEVDGVSHDGTDSVKLSKRASAVATDRGRESAGLDELLMSGANSMVRSGKY